MTSNNSPAHEPDFYIGNIAIHGRVLLAPMDGYTDMPFRQICKQFGSSISYSEFINGIDVVHSHPHLKYKTFFVKEEKPFAYQIFDDNPNRLLQAAIQLQQLNPCFFDINMGCSARNVSNRGAGAGLLKDPHKIQRIVQEFVTTFDIPITAKIRLGWDGNSKNYLQVVKILEDSGISAIAVHARTRIQEYSGLADWSAIAEIKRLVKVPVIGNGDVLSLSHAHELITKTGCDAVMIGRAAIGNPWIFNGEDRRTISPSELARVVCIHISSMLNLYGDNLGTILFRKHLARYLVDFMQTPEIRQDIFSIDSPERLLEAVNKLLKI